MTVERAWHNPAERWVISKRLRRAFREPDILVRLPARATGRWGMAGRLGPKMSSGAWALTIAEHDEAYHPEAARAAKQLLRDRAKPSSGDMPSALSRSTTRSGNA